MIEVILTSRPVSKKIISFVNAFTRAKTKSPFDHVAIKYNNHIYESTAGKGVHIIHFDEWKKGRESTYLFVYKNVVNVDFDFFELNHGKKYDYLANVQYLFNLKNSLAFRSTKKYFCSELVAGMLGLNNPYKYTPADIELFLRTNYYELKIETV